MYNKGFTLAEMVVVIGIAGLMMTVVVAFQRDVINNNKFAQDSLSETQDARNILRVMVKEMRSASAGSDGSFAIAQAATSSITFFSDTDGDGTKDKIRYFIASSTLKKGIIKPTGSPLSYVSASELIIQLATDVQNSSSTPLFEYYDNTYTGTTTPLTQPVTVTNVRLVKINLVIDANPYKAPIIKSYTSQVNFRNLKDNL